ncbi:hypothetical protein G6F35_014929 [Rhizopus arrhizus]|nr:hypothetical protein G6F35_014929 [Rhizopus arrhizus]
MTAPRRAPPHGQAREQCHAGIAVIEVVVEQPQCRIVRRRIDAFGAVQGDDIAAPGQQQLLYCRQGVGIVVDHQHTGAPEGAAGVGRRFDPRCHRCCTARHADREHRTAIDYAAQLQRCVQQGRDALRDGQPQPQALAIAAVHPMEFLEYHRLLLGCDAGPGVVHTDGQALAVATHAQQNAAVAGVADGIGQEVLQHAAQQQRIAMHPGVGAQVPELQAARRCQYRKFLRQRVQHG